jgi:ribonuclease HI
MDIETPDLEKGIGIHSAVQTWEVAKRLPNCTTNNEAEYEGVLLALLFAIEKSVGNLFLYTDSRLIRNQILGRQPAKDQRMKSYLAQVQSLLQDFDLVRFEWTPRTANRHADRLCREVLRGDSARIFKAPLRPRERPSLLPPAASARRRTNPFV